MLSPWNGVVRFGKREKLSLRYVRPYEIIEKVGWVAYILALLLELSRIYEVHQESMLCKYLSDPSHVLEMQSVGLKDSLFYEEHSVKIINRREQVLRTKIILLVKVIWRNHNVDEAT